MISPDLRTSTSHEESLDDAMVLNSRSSRGKLCQLPPDLSHRQDPIDFSNFGDFSDLGDLINLGDPTDPTQASQP